MARPRVLLADDHVLVAEAFKRVLEPEFDVVATVSDGRSLLEEAQQLKPDVTLLDLGLPLLNGMDAGRQLKKLLPKTKIIVLTMSEDYDLASLALKEWASGYLLKKSAGGELVQAVRDVLKGKSYVTSYVAERLLEEFVRD